MNILLINQYYPPDTSATAFVAEMYARALAKRHQVTVLAGRPSYNPIKKYPWSTWTRLVDGPLTVERVGSTSYGRTHMGSRVANYLSYLGLMVFRALAIKADLILCMTDPPVTGLVGAIIGTLRKCRFIYCIQDLHPDMAIASKLIRKGLLTSLWEGMNRWALNKADAVITLGEDMRRKIVLKGIEQNKIHVIRLGAPQGTESPLADHPTISNVRCGFPFTVLHAGNLGFYGAWETMIKAAMLLEDDQVGLIFVGDGAARSRIEKLVSTQDNVRFLPFRPREEIPYVMAAGDLHVVTIRRGLEGLVVPSKLYTILAAGKPVLAIAPHDSDVAQIVLKEGCGAVVDPDDAKAVCKAIRNLASHPELMQEMTCRAVQVAKKYKQSAQLESFVNLVESSMDYQKSKQPDR